MGTLVSLLEKLRQIPKPTRKYLPYLFMVFLLILFVLLFPKKSLSIFVIAVLLIVSSFSTIYKRLTQISIGIELISFSTIMLLYSYGMLMALVGLFIVTLLSSVIEGQLDSFPKQFFATVTVCILILPFLGFPPLIGGMIFVIIRNIVLFIMYFFLYGSSWLSAIGPVTLNLIFNYVLLDKWGERILSMLQ